MVASKGLNQNKWGQTRLFCVVEGVETKDQLEILKSISFRCFQGYYFHKPEPIENIINHQKRIAIVS